MTNFEKGQARFLTYLNCKDFQLRSKISKTIICDRLPIGIAVLQKLSTQHQRYTVNYIEYAGRARKWQKIGIIKPGINCWYSFASLEFGAFCNSSDKPNTALIKLVENYLKIAQAGIKFEVSENFYHYTIARDSWLIKIDLREEDCLATIRDGNDLLFEYFPTLNDAIACSFDLILNSDRSTDSSCDEEF